MNRKDKGVVILEVLMAVVLFALCVTPIFVMMINAQRSTRIGYLEAEITRLASSVIEYNHAGNKALFANDFNKTYELVSGENPKNNDPQAIRYMQTELNKLITIPGDALICINTEDKKKDGTVNAGVPNPDPMLERANLAGKVLKVRAYWYAVKRQQFPNIDASTNFSSSDCTNDKADEKFGNDDRIHRLNFSYSIYTKATL